VGWAEQCPPLFICYVNNGGQAGTKLEKKMGRRADLRWLLSLVELLESTSSITSGLWRLAVLLLLLPLSSVFHSFLCIFFSFFQSFPSLLYSCSLLFSSLLFVFFSLPSSLSPISFFFFSSPVAKTGEGHGWGGHCAAAPPPPLQHVESFSLASGVGRRLFERESTSF